MNQGYFGQYQSGFQTVPDNAYAMMTAPTKEIAGAINGAVGTLAGSYLKRREEQAGNKAFKQGAATQYKGLETVAQATGVPMNPELANQYMALGEMKTPQQQAAFQQSLGQEAQRMQNLYNIANQQRQYGMQQRGLYNQNIISAGLNAPFNSSMSTGYGGINPALFPQPSPAQNYWNQSMGQ